MPTITKKRFIRFLLTLSLTFVIIFGAGGCVSGQKTAPAFNPVGNWQSIDLVREIDQFKPDSKSWQGDLFLKQCRFDENGGMSLPWTWNEKGVAHLKNNVRYEYHFKSYNGKTYLFLPWLCGDVINDNQKPAYYVLTKTEQ